jgi:FkbM family methyltransferase
VKHLAKKLLRSAGLDLSRLSSLRAGRNQPADDPFVHQQRLLRATPPRVIFDIGANTGQTTAEFTRLFPAATIYAFEPFDESFQKLQAAHGTAPHVRLFQVALSDQVGTSRFYTSNHAVMASLLPLSSRAALLTQATTAGEVEVQTTTVDRFCGEHGLKGIDILKIDVQGGELRVLQGAEQLLAAGAIRLVFAEVNFNELYDGQAFFHDVAGYLHQHHYSLYGLYQMAYSPRGPIGWADALFVSPAVMDSFS